MEIGLCGYKVLIDDEDYDKVLSYSWCINHYARDKRNKIYFLTNKQDENGKYRTKQMHRILMNIENKRDGIVDHINGNTLDNRKSNLRICTIAENTRNQKIRKTNTSGYKGVCFDKRSNKWQANIRINYKNIFLGRFINIEDAYRAYCDASKEYHGSFGKTE